MRNTMTTTTGGPTRRERARAATISEIKETALRLMRETGTTDLRFSDIAREMGMTAPALYRYFSDSSDLLTALIVDAYEALAETVAGARDSVADDDVLGRLRAVSQAYRAWAREEPQRFALILGMPVPGYAAPEEGPTTDAAKRAMNQLQSLVFDAARLGVLRPPLVTDVAEPFAQCILAKHAGDDILPVATDDSGHHGLSPASFQAMLSIWAALHGFVSLEAYGHLDWLTPEARDALFEANVRVAAITVGLPIDARR